MSNLRLFLTMDNMLAIQSIIYQFKAKQQLSSLSGVNGVFNFAAHQKLLFAQHSKLAIFGGPADSLSFIKLEDKQPHFISRASKFDLVKVNDMEYLLSLDSASSLAVKNLQSGAVSIYKDVSDYLLSTDQKSLVMKKKNSGRAG